MTLRDRLSSPGPKRILALDGGGARVILALGFLEGIERELRERHRKPDLVLADYFDLIGGTSAGALVAAGLAIGMDMRSIIDYGIGLAERIFCSRKWQPWQALYNEAPLLEILKERFGDITLGDDAIRTGLCIVTKRADTDSTWPFINHPDGQFYAANRDILLRNIVRASTAAPVYFVPQGMDVGDGEQAAFFDGGVSMANNPALQLFAVATLSGFPFQWKTGADQLLLTSIGTGEWDVRHDAATVLRKKAWDWAWEVPTMLIRDADVQNQMLLQWMSRSPTARQIDSEIGDLGPDLLAREPLLHYLRYNITLTAEALTALGFAGVVPRVDELRSLNCARWRHDLLAIGQAGARAQLDAGHFPREFDLGAAGA